MCCSKILLARVGLEIASEKQVERVSAHVNYCESCHKKLQDIRKVASMVPGPFCLSGEQLVRSADAPVDEAEDEHLMACSRCSAIGFTIVHLPEEQAREAA